jgi:hypothetical protein
MTKPKETMSHNGDYACKTKTIPQIELPRLWAVVCIPTGQVIGVDTLKSRADAILRIVPQELRENYVVWRYDPHHYNISGVIINETVKY